MLKQCMLFLQVVVTPEVKVAKVEKYTLGTIDKVIAFIWKQLCVPMLACISVNQLLSNGQAFYIAVPPTLDLDMGIL